MGARLKAILAGVGVLLLTVLTLGGWALVERKGRQRERERADRLQAGHDLRDTHADAADATRQAVEDAEAQRRADALLVEASRREAEAMARHAREEAARRARQPSAVLDAANGSRFDP